MRAIDRLNGRVWNADVGDDDVTAVGLAGGQHQRQLRGAERHGERRVDAGADGIGCVGRQA